MAGLKPWYLVAVPREDLRKGRPLDAAELAIHLDQVIDGRAPRDYLEPELFFARTYFTDAYTKMAVEVMQRLSGDIRVSPGINLTTQFGGGKTHFLTLLYHLFREGEKAKGWSGVRELLEQASLSTVPRADVAVFIGNRFDFLVGAGAEGKPKRRTPWGDLAWQLAKSRGNHSLFSMVESHDREGVAPGGEIIQRWFDGRPTLILMDEVLNFIRRARDAGDPYRKLASQMYSFLEILTREVPGTPRAVLAVSLPMSEYEMTQEDQADYQRLSKVLDRLSKAVLLSEQIEIAEIVRRRLFEHIGDPKDVRRTAKAYADWVKTHRQQLPEWFPVDQGEKLFQATYPFHPTVISVFERKWQSLPRFQRTRGILRLLALWVSHACQQDFSNRSREPLITLGSAPLSDNLFRAAVFEQLGEERLEAAVVSDIAGPEAHAGRLDAEAPESIRAARLHQKIATVVFFESSGGQVRNEATLPEVRLAVGEPGLEIGNVESALDDLIHRCYYLDAKGTAYLISHRPNLNKILADRRATLFGHEAEENVREKVRQAIREIFREGPKTPERRYFPETSGDIPDTASLTLVILAPEHSWEIASREATRRHITRMIQEYGSRRRTFKTGLLFAVAESGSALEDEAKTLLALESLEDPTEQERLKLEPAQIRELKDKKQRVERDLRELVWRTYRRLLLLVEDESIREIDLGLIHPSSAESLVGLILSRLKQEALLEESISPDFLVRNWPPALTEWPTKSVREGKFAYGGREPDGSLAQPVIDHPTFHQDIVEFSDQVLLLPRDKALSLLTGPPKTKESPISYPTGIQNLQEESQPSLSSKPSIQGYRSLSWEGRLPPQKWMNFYTRVLTHFANDPSLQLRLRMEVAPETGISQTRVEEIQAALRDLGLDELGLNIQGD